MSYIKKRSKYSQNKGNIECAQCSVTPEIDVEDWMPFLLRTVALPEVYFFPLVIGFIALLASSSVGMAIVGGGLFAVGALGAGLHFFSAGEDEFEDYSAYKHDNNYSYNK